MVSFFAALRPYMIQRAMDDYVLQTHMDGFGRYCALIALVLLVEILFQYVYIYHSNWLGQEVVHHLRKRVFAKITSLKVRYFDVRKTGSVVTRVVSDIQAIADIFGQGLLSMVGDGLKIFGFLGIMFYMEWRLTLIVLMVFPILFFITRWFQKAIKKSFHDFRSQNSRLNAFVTERIQGMNLIQSFNREEAEMKKFQVINQKYLQANLRTIWYFSLYFPLVDFLSSFAVAVLVWFGGYRALFYEDVTLGTLVAFIYLVQAFFRPLRQMADKFNTIQMGFVACQRVFQVLDDRDIEQDKGTYTKPLEGHIHFEKVSFSYAKDTPLFRDLDFEIPPHRFAALVGASGSGKTTVISLINKLYEIDSGSICIDGVDIRDISLSHLRKNIGVVLQEPFLFSGTIYHNLTMYREVSMQRIEKAVQELGMMDFIEGIPGGFYFDVGERGIRLSLGQRQLVALLRVYIQSPPIVILDEATASVDSKTEAIIQQALGTLAQKRTLLVIAHRLATVRYADQIFVMNRGLLVEQGSHDDLMLAKGVYRQLYDAWIRDDE